MNSRGAGLLSVAVLAISIALGLAACGGSDEVSIGISDPWARTSAMSQTMGAAYMTITGGSEDDRLVSASVPADVAAEAQLHETVMASDSEEDMETTEGMGTSEDMGTTEDMGDQMTMREVEAIDVPADETVDLEPGGYHVMLIDLAAPLEAGSTFELTLDFENAGEQVVEVTVRDA